VRVTPAVASLEAPSSMATNAPVSVRFKGPRHARHWIGFVRRGTLEYRDYAAVPAEGDAVELRAPEEAGDYDLVFVIDNDAIVRTPVSVR